MEIVIKIPEDVYTRLFDKGMQDNEIATDDICEMAKALRLGTPLEAQPTEMRDATEEERKSVKDYIESISKPTGVHFDEAQPCEDCISREEAIACCRNEWEEEVEERLRTLPSVTPERPKGEWIQTKDDCDGVNFYDFSFECSKCGKEQSFKSNYCPNCGAEMCEGGEE